MILALIISHTKVSLFSLRVWSTLLRFSKVWAKSLVFATVDIIDEPDEDKGEDEESISTCW